MPSRRSQRALRAMRTHRRFFQTVSSQVLEMMRLPDEAVAELSIYGTRGRLLESDVPAVLVMPRRVVTNEAVLLHFHGGAYVSGNLLQARMVISPISAAAHLQGITFSYRLAPEHPYPAQLEDAMQVYRLLLKMGVRPEKIGFVGESAGGNLALALALSLKEKGQPLPGALCLLSPWTDPAQTGESYRTLREVDATLNADELMVSARDFVGGEEALFNDPLVSPIYADFTGFPPTQIHVGDSEILLSDSQRLLQCMQRDAVDVSLIRWAGMPHVFQIYGFEESRASIKTMGSFLQQTLGKKTRGRAAAEVRETGEET